MNCERILSVRQKKIRGKQKQLCADEKREGIGGRGVRMKGQSIVSRKRANSRTVYGEEEGGKQGTWGKGREKVSG